MLLARHQLDMLFAHAATGSTEVCGILTGRAWPGVVVESVIAARNVHPQPQRHFLLDAATLLQADHAARVRGHTIIGFYHSHPNGLALPSALDHREAWPQLLTVIIAVEQGRPRCLSAWRCADTMLQPEPIEIHAGVMPLAAEA
ncbi:MAG: peptidase [Chloroflexi bacterium]|nr:MAG: peptidase [Chloroflexota bacterium]